MTQLGKYEILEELGKGGFGVVYKARDLSLERDVALKVLHPQLTVDQRFIENFRREARNLARIHHPNVVAIYEIGEEDGRLFIAMSYLPGGSLEDRLKREGLLNIVEALNIIKSVGAGLEAGHKRNIIHRDIKPGNILFDEDGQAVIADFGVARAVQLSSQGTSTQSSGTVGTPFYRPPELWRGTPPPSPATDVYSLACVLYEMLTGKVLFSGDTPDQLITKHLLEDARTLMESGHDNVPAEVKLIIEKALAKEPTQRYQSTNSFFEALTQTQKPQRPAVQAETKATADQAPVHAEPTERSRLRPSSTESTKETIHVGAKPTEPVPLKQRLPAWLPWTVVGIIGVILLIVLLSGIGRPTDKVLTETAVAELVEAVVAVATNATATATDTAVTTLTKAPMPSPTATETQVLTPTPTAEPTLGIGSTMVNPVDGALRVYVPEGEFTMGSEDGDATDDEKPEHPVWLDAFWIYQTEVTNAQYRQCVEEDACQLPGDTTKYQDADYADHPVVRLSWYDADAYCQWSGGQLPTEAQWEKAARGTDRRKYPWGNESLTCSLANYSGCIDGTAPVGSYDAGVSPYGALDMAGNVWEWVADWYDISYYSRSPYENPAGPTDGNFRVIRGGSWFADDRYLRVSFRLRYYPDFSVNYFGFRCLLSP